MRSYLNTPLARRVWDLLEEHNEELTEIEEAHKKVSIKQAAQNRYDRAIEVVQLVIDAERIGK